jgi:hypothetical protein
MSEPEKHNRFEVASPQVRCLCCESLRLRYLYEGFFYQPYSFFVRLR